MRLNGKDVPLPAQRLDGAVEQIGAVVIREGFVRGDRTNVLQIDMRKYGTRARPAPGHTRPRRPVLVTADIFFPGRKRGVP